MILNECGIVAQECYKEIPEHFPFVILDEYVIMPNHIHGILIIDRNDHPVVSTTRYVENNRFNCSWL